MFVSFEWVELFGSPEFGGEAALLRMFFQAWATRIPCPLSSLTVSISLVEGIRISSRPALVSISLWKWSLNDFRSFFLAVSLSNAFVFLKRLRARS